jgi:hypothetical protein
MSKWLLGGVLILSCLILACCGGAEETPAVPTPAGLGDDAPPDFPFGNKQWPESIPDDIPKLEGEIQMVMEASTHIRIFYINLSERQVEQYLDQLEAVGFQFEFLVYTQEGFPDKSEERMKKGEWDAVDITKGDYHMRLEYGAEQATYDVYTTGF